jgi:hypothetical protein
VPSERIGVFAPHSLACNHSAPVAMGPCGVAWGQSTERPVAKSPMPAPHCFRTIVYSPSMAVASISPSARVQPSEGPADGRNLEVLHNADGFVMATWKNVAIHVWTVEATIALVEALDRLSATFTGAHPEGISAIHIIAKNAPLPPAHIREELGKVTKRYANRLACVCHVVEGSGFWASALHGFLTGLHWIARGPFRLHICSDIPAAARWVPAPHAEVTKVPIGIAALEEVMRTVRRLAD